MLEISETSSLRGADQDCDTKQTTTCPCSTQCDASAVTELFTALEETPSWKCMLSRGGKIFWLISLGPSIVAWYRRTKFWGWCKRIWWASKLESYRDKQSAWYCTTRSWPNCEIHKMDMVVYTYTKEGSVVGKTPLEPARLSFQEMDKTWIIA